MNRRKLFILHLILSLIFTLGLPDVTNAQNNVIIIVMDGAGWIHTFGAGNEYIPHLYDDMRPLGTLYTNFRIDYNAGGQTLSNPGHATIATGTWQNILNNGTQRPTHPTIFEYYRSHFSATQNTCYVIAGKNKLNILTYSDYAGYGEPFGSSWLGDNLADDATLNNVVSIMSTIKPNLLIVNFADVDHAGDSGNLSLYTAAITNADNYIYQIWQIIQSGVYGYDINNTTLFITNDHGRNDTIMTEHGDGCEGCTHIMLLALGRNVVPQSINTTTYQRDIAPTVGDLLEFPTPFSQGQSLFEYSPPLPIELTLFTSRLLINSILLKWETKTEVNNYGFEIERKVGSGQSSVGNYEKIGFVNGNGNSNSPKSYSYEDNALTPGKYSYRLKQIDNDGQFEYSKTIEVDFNSPKLFELSQNYPNPFNPKTTIRFSIPEAGNVKISLYNPLGQEVSTILNEVRESGTHIVNFDASELNSGMYIYKLESGSFIQTRKMILLK
ncbi:MAG TPA: hypothetical protein DHV28_08200 [Ignavibacteriales bacterium]|nr:hypothetical protein [Ignavibacteriales bacterium]